MNKEELLKLLKLRLQLEDAVKKGDKRNIKEVTIELVDSFDREKLKSYLGEEKWGTLSEIINSQENKSIEDG